jgi:hypothetical protein
MPAASHVGSPTFEVNLIDASDICGRRSYVKVQFPGDPLFYATNSLPSNFRPSLIRLAEIELHQSERIYASL